MEQFYEVTNLSRISDALENGEKFHVPFATGKILRLSMAMESSFYVSNVCVSPVEGLDDLMDWGFEISDQDGNSIYYVCIGDFVQTDVQLITDGVPFNDIAKDINDFLGKKS